MIKMGYPPINTQQRTNEQNMQSMKSWSSELLDNLNYQIAMLEERITALEKKGGDDDGGEGRSVTES